MKLTEEEKKHITKYVSPYAKIPFGTLGMILTADDRKVLKTKAKSFDKCLSDLLAIRGMTRVQLEKLLGYSLWKNANYAQPNDRKLIDIAITLKLDGAEFEELCECGNHRIGCDYEEPINAVYVKICNPEIPDEIKYSKAEIDELIYTLINKHYFM